MANALLMSWTSTGAFKTMDERLERLVTQAQRHAPQTEGWQLALNQLVDEILRSRQTGRPLIRQPLFGVCRDITYASSE